MISEDIKDCGWCGMPMEIVHHYEWTVKRDGKKIPKDMVTARCLNDHWYGGSPKALVKGAGASNPEE